MGIRIKTRVDCAEKLRKKRMNEIGIKRSFLTTDNKYHAKKKKKKLIEYEKSIIAIRAELTGRSRKSSETTVAI